MERVDKFFRKPVVWIAIAIGTAYVLADTISTIQAQNAQISNQREEFIAANMRERKCPVYVPPNILEDLENYGKKIPTILDYLI